MASVTADYSEITKSLSYMFSEILSASNSISFFQSLAFGIIAMVLVGGSWCFVGYIMGKAPKNNIDTNVIQFFTALFSVITSLVIAWINSSWETGITNSIAIYACISYFISGILGFCQLQIMSKAMQTGPNGVIWSIIQAGCVAPFIVSIVFFDVVLTWARGLGISMLLASLVLFVFTKDNERKGGNLWLLESFICFGVVAIQQNLVNWPSYYEEATKLSSIVRTLCVATGTLTISILYTIFKITPEQKQVIISSVKNRKLWIYVISLQFISLLVAYTLHYPGMDVMAAFNRGGMCYPLMVGSCIVFFSLISILILKEKIRLIQLLAIAICVTGLIMICTSA